MKYKKIANVYITMRNYLYKGMSDLSAVKYLTYLGVGVGALTEAMTVPEAIGWGLLFLVASFAYGAVYDYLNWYDAEAEWGNRRNPFTKEVRRKLVAR